ncbi:RNA 2',3'-cyclic phosphodiesterase [Gaoshiqia sp. Z1-71]|uniref:RNA 2',3'-cyclic phosphodiesterase n=1 Tax=Gaoshiqia hydrogeniformans TaxID=3290090 RepID=UPI003BF90F1D
MKRTFIAIQVELNAEFSKLVFQMKKDLSGEQIRWVPEQNLHLTLRFLGDTPEEGLTSVKAVLQQLSKTAKAFSFRLQGISSFRRHGSPNIIFAEIHERKPLSALVNRLNELLAGAGFSPEGKAFRPHLTLARIKQLKDRAHFDRVLNRPERRESQEVQVTEIIFYESILKATGPVYEPLVKFPLNSF